MEENHNLPKHIAIIMDGNRRWAKKRGLPSQLGHSEGANTLERIADDCEELGIKFLTVYAFSTENWKRSKDEVDYLMKLLAKNIRDFDKRIKNRNIRFRLVGDITGLNSDLQEGIRSIEERTKDKTGLTVNIAINYGGRAELTYAMKKILENNLKVEDIDENTVSKFLQTKDSPDPDLLIRTSGELRTSNFLPWQLVYSEFVFVEKNWPDFSEEDLDEAIKIYQTRNRKFGAK